MNFADWDLPKFFEELFDYCFPIDYHMEQRLRLKWCFQNDKKVSTYVHELEELYNMIGAVDERGKVVKLWYGLRGAIQEGLWQDFLNPETSTWLEVVKHAAILEVAQWASNTKDRRQNNDTQNNRVLQGIISREILTERHKDSSPKDLDLNPSVKVLPTETRPQETMAVLVLYNQ